MARLIRLAKDPAVKHHYEWINIPSAPYNPCQYGYR